MEEELIILRFPLLETINKQFVCRVHFIAIYQTSVDDFSVFDCSSPFYFLLIELYYTFSLSYIVLSCYVYYYCVPPGAADELQVQCYVSYLIHPLLWVVTTPRGRQARATSRSWNFPIYCLLYFFPFSLFLLVSFLCFFVQVLGKHSCMSFTFYLAILNGICCLRSPGINFVLVGESD